MCIYRYMADGEAKLITALEDGVLQILSTVDGASSFSTIVLY
jgi:hypothetical protein